MPGHENVAKLPCSAQTGWPLTRQFILSDHPVSLVLLCHKRFGPQKGQHGSCRTIAVAMANRSVVIETGLCRSGRDRATRDERFREGGDA